MSRTVPQQKPGRSQQDYHTPACFLEPVKQYLGITKFLFDFAASSENTVCARYWDKATNSLAQKHWEDQVKGGWGWLNPEFADIREWAWRCADAAKAGGHIALLVPASVGSNWFRDFVHGHAYVLALNGRIPFMPEKPDWGYPKDCILALYGPAFEPGFDVWTWRRQA